MPQFSYWRCCKRGTFWSGVWPAQLAAKIYCRMTAAEGGSRMSKYRKDTSASEALLPRPIHRDPSGVCAIAADEH